MVAALLYFLAYTIVMKYMPGIKDDAGQIDVRLFIASVGSLVGIVEGLIGWVRSRQWISMIFAPLVCASVAAMAWFTAAALPWTHDERGVPTQWGFIILAITFTVLASVLLKLVEVLLVRVKKAAARIKQTYDEAFLPASSRSNRTPPAQKSSSDEDQVDPFSP